MTQFTKDNHPFILLFDDSKEPVLLESERDFTKEFFEDWKGDLNEIIETCYFHMKRTGIPLQWKCCQKIIDMIEKHNEKALSYAELFV